MDAVSETEDEVPDDFAPTIVAESSKPLKTMTVASAVMALDMTDEPVLFFRNPGKQLKHCVPPQRRQYWLDRRRQYQRIA